MVGKLTRGSVDRGTPLLASKILDKVARKAWFVPSLYICIILFKHRVVLGGSLVSVPTGSVDRGTRWFGWAWDVE